MEKPAFGIHYKLPDTEQTSWQLASIQLTSLLSLPVIATSFSILESNSFLNSVIILVLSNIIVWFIRLGILAMSHRNRKSTMDLSHEYIGRVGSYAIACILLLSTLAWYVVQTTMASMALSHLTRFEEGLGIDRFIQISVGIGILSTLFCMEGIVLLRWLSMIALPILLLAFVALVFFAPEQSFPEQPIHISLISLALVVGTNLGITVDLPTFFRHSRSWKTSLKALALIQVISLLIGLGGLYVGSMVSPLIKANGMQAIVMGNYGMTLAAILLIFTSAVCANVANVYSASVGWEIVAPASLVGRKEYLILGLGLTTIFILVEQIFTMHTLLSVADSAVINLCLVFAIAYIRRRITGRSPTAFDQTSYLIAWLVATLLSILQHFDLLLSDYSTLLVSVVTILIITSLIDLGRKLHIAPRGR